MSHDFVDRLGMSSACLTWAVCCGCSHVEGQLGWKTQGGLAQVALVGAGCWLDVSVFLLNRLRQDSVGAR